MPFTKFERWCYGLDKPKRIKKKKSASFALLGIILLGKTLKELFTARKRNKR